MADIKALFLLSKEVKNIRAISSSPVDYSSAARYKQKTETVINKTLETTKQITNYATDINAGMEALQAVLKETSKKVQDAMKKTLDSIQVGGENLPTGGQSPSVGQSPSGGQSNSVGQSPSGGKSPSGGQSSTNLLLHVRELQRIEENKKRLEEFIVQTEIVIAKIKDTAGCTFDDIEALKGYMTSYQLEKDKTYEAEKRQLEEEKSKREADERLRKEKERKQKEEEERRRKEEEERRKREEDERLKREEDEKQRKEEEENSKREADERLRKEEERKQKEEEERRRKEEEERRKREEDERLKREEDEKLRKEEEERKRKEEKEERRRQEEEARRKEEEEIVNREEEKRNREEERRKREEEERLKLEEENRRKKAENDKKMQEEMKRRKRLEDEARVREEERQKREAENREKEKLEREADEKRRKLDPNNWSPVVFKRCDGEVDGDFNYHKVAIKRSDGEIDEDSNYHKDVCCVTISPVGTDIECLASDDADELKNVHADGENILSSVVSIHSKKGTVDLEAPMRAYLPYRHVTDDEIETVVKCTINGNDWQEITTCLPTPNVLVIGGPKLLGAELNTFENAKVVVAARRKGETIVVDKQGVSKTSAYDRNIQVVVPVDAFEFPTELRVTIRPVPDKSLVSGKTDKNIVKSLLSSSSLVTIACRETPKRNVHVDFLRPNTTGGSRSLGGKTHQLYRTADNVWNFADTKVKENQHGVTVILPSSREKYVLLELEMLQSVQRENVLKTAEVMYDYANKTVVQLILKQKKSNPTLAIVHCVRREMVKHIVAELKSLGYTKGADTSREFCMKEGQKLHITCTGNITTSTGTDGVIVLPFYKYMDSAKQEMTLSVKAAYDQRNLPEYTGTLKCVVISSDGQNDNSGVTIEMPLFIPKDYGAYGGMYKVSGKKK